MILSLLVTYCTNFQTLVITVHFGVIPGTLIKYLTIYLYYTLRHSLFYQYGIQPAVEIKDMKTET